MKTKAGFTLLELLVGLVLTLVVLLLLFRGFQAVTDSLQLGERRMELSRRLAAAERVFREDVEHMVVRPEWPMFLGPTSFGFMRYDPRSEGDTETEFVMYFRRDRSDEPRLEEWVRRRAPGSSRDLLSTVNWWAEIPASDWSEEVLLDALIAPEIVFWDAAGERVSLGLQDAPPALVDVQLAVTLLPARLFPGSPSSNLRQRIRQEEGAVMDFRVAIPGIGVNP